MPSIRESSVDGSTSNLTMNARDRRAMEGKKASKRMEMEATRVYVKFFALRVFFLCVINK